MKFIFVFFTLFLCVLSLRKEAAWKKKDSFSFKNVLRMKNQVSNFKKEVEDVTSPFHNAAYNRLAYIVDTYGPRLWVKSHFPQFISFNEDNLKLSSLIFKGI